MKLLDREKVYGSPLLLEGTANDYLAERINASGILAYADRFGGRQTVIQLVKEAAAREYGSGVFEQNMTEEMVEKLFESGSVRLDVRSMETFDLQIAMRMASYSSR